MWQFTPHAEFWKSLRARRHLRWWITRQDSTSWSGYTQELTPRDLANKHVHRKQAVPTHVSGYTHRTSVQEITQTNMYTENKLYLHTCLDIHTGPQSKRSHKQTCTQKTGCPYTRVWIYTQELTPRDLTNKHVHRKQAVPTHVSGYTHRTSLQEISQTNMYTENKLYLHTCLDIHTGTHSNRSRKQTCTQKTSYPYTRVWIYTQELTQRDLTNKHVHRKQAIPTHVSGYTHRNSLKEISQTNMYTENRLSPTHVSGYTHRNSLQEISQTNMYTENKLSLHTCLDIHTGTHSKRSHKQTCTQKTGCPYTRVWIYTQELTPRDLTNKHVHRKQAVPTHVSGYSLQEISQTNMYKRNTRRRFSPFLQQ